MKCKKIIAPLAEQDIKEIALHYNSKRKGLGKEFTQEVRKATAYIVDFPEAFQIRYNQIRVTLVDVFPYGIHYFFDQINNTVFITAVLRDSRDPENWKNRSL
jgi:plasmid stabilization system protein ParE